MRDHLIHLHQILQGPTPRFGAGMFYDSDSVQARATQPVTNPRLCSEVDNSGAFDFGMKPATSPVTPSNKPRSHTATGASPACRGVASIVYRSTLTGIPPIVFRGFSCSVAHFGVGSATMGPVVFGPLMEVIRAFSGCCNISSTAVAS